MTRPTPTRATRLAPLLLRPDNVTPPSRTPWGGRRIAGTYKKDLGLGLDPDAPIGESWELSVEPSFPSRVVDGRTLEAVIAEDPEGWLGPELARAHGGRLPLLVKILDAGADLSVQVHPAADDPGLEDGESGKPEAWIILEADEGAGIYLGWREGVDRTGVERVLSEGGDLSKLLNFVEVAPGEVYLVPPGTPHAIGRGVCLVEPQFVVPGRRAVTYRFWDWNRRYDAVGRPDPAGRPRDLHVARALAVTDWRAARGEALVEESRTRSGGGAGDARTDSLQIARLVDCRWFGAERVCGAGTVALPMGAFIVILCLSGTLSLRSDDHGGELKLGQGQSAIVPAAAQALELSGQAVDAIMCWPAAR